MGRHTRLLLCVGMAAVALCCHAQDLEFSSLGATNSAVRTTLTVPTNVTRVVLETCTSLVTGDWTNRALQHIPEGDDATFFDLVDGTTGFARCVATNDLSFSGRRLRLLYNGYVLTTDPRRALSATSTVDRCRLYVLEAVLINPLSGRIAAVYPYLSELGQDPPPQALTVQQHPVLAEQETPPPPDTDLAAVLAAWRARGVSETLLNDLDAVDLKGAVVTPGLIDGHLHVTSWSKKIPDEGEQFGYFADVSDPRYYIDATNQTQRDTREALDLIVTDANAYLDGNSRTGILLHGYVRTEVDEEPTNATAPEIYLYACSSAGCGETEFNSRYLINGVGRGAQSNLVEEAALLVHTSGQVCWYNGELLARYNAAMQSLSNRFDALDVDSITPPAGDGSIWEFEMGSDTGGGVSLFDLAPPVNVDLVVERGPPDSDTVYVPYTVGELDDTNRIVYAELQIPELGALATGTVVAAWMIPFYRAIPTCISGTVWEDAGTFRNKPVATSGVGYGQWDPRCPHESNWYNGAERGLVQYFYDGSGGVWRPSGYAEHYVMRDLLGAVVQRPPTVEDGIRFRRNLARWCHRHGLTGVNDIMFYRRRTTKEDFYAYEALSHAHDPVTDEAFFTNRNLSTEARTGEFNLRVGAYYYIENVEQIDDVLDLADHPEWGPDPDRLCPDPGHPEYPGWVRWLGWKLQLDGGTGARTLFSSAPMAKTTTTHAFSNLTTEGETVVFHDHGYGLLTMTSDQEQIFDSRESAALYWLVRESDTNETTWHNTLITNDWTFLRQGVGYWPDLDPNESVLAADLRLLDRVDMTITNDGPLDAAANMAEKVGLLFDQVESGYKRTLTALARIWYAKSVAAGTSNPIASQVACHNIGDGSVDLYTRVVWTLKNDLATLSTNYAELPDYWKDAIPPDADLNAVHRGFTNERFRIEHLLCFSPFAVNLIKNPSVGLEKNTAPADRNMVFSTQPALLVVDGQAFRTIGFPDQQELWEIPHGTLSNFWRGLPARPRSDHHMPCPVFMDYDIPFALNTDPPSVRDPRPAVTMIGAVARSPVEFDPGNWLDKTDDTPDVYPPEYLVSKVFPPLGLEDGGQTNNMQLTVGQTLCAMTFWSAYNAGCEAEMGAIASPASMPTGPGWFADMVVWRYNPLAIRGPLNLTLPALAHLDGALLQTQKVETVNTFIDKFRPAMTIVGGMPVYRSAPQQSTLQADFVPNETP